MLRSVALFLSMVLVACGSPPSTGGTPSTPPPVPVGCQAFASSVSTYDDLPEGTSYHIAGTPGSFAVAWQSVDREVPRATNLRLFNLSGATGSSPALQLPHSNSDLALLVGTSTGNYFAETVEAKDGKPVYWLHALKPDGTLSASKEVVDSEGLPSISAFAADSTNVLAVAGGSNAGESFYSLSRLKPDASLASIATIRDPGTTCPVVGGMAVGGQQLAFGAAREVVDMGTRRLSVFLRKMDGSVSEIIIDEHLTSALEKSFYCNSFFVYIKKIVALGDGSFIVLWWDGLTNSEHLVAISASGVKGSDTRIVSDQFAPVSDLAVVGSSLIGSVYQYNKTSDEVGVISIPANLNVATATYRKLGLMSWEAPKLAVSGRLLAVVTSGAPKSRAYFFSCQ